MQMQISMFFYPLFHTISTNDFRDELAANDSFRDELNELLKNAPVENIKALITFFNDISNALAILFFCYQLREMFKHERINGINVPINSNQISSVKELLDLAKESQKWLHTNQESLSLLKVFWIKLERNSLPCEIELLKNISFLSIQSGRISLTASRICQMTNLITLELMGNGLISLPNDIGKLTNLRDLNLSCNRLTSLPNDIGKLTNLVSLYLSGNKLTSLPNDIWKLNNLVSLYLSDNELTSLPNDIWKLNNLVSLYLSDNRMTSLPNDIGKLSNLKVLDLHSNLLTTISPQIGGLTTLQVLYLKDNPLVSLPKCVLSKFLKRQIILGLEYQNINNPDFWTDVADDQETIPTKICASQ